MLQGPAADPFARPQADSAPESSDTSPVAVSSSTRAGDRFIEEVAAPEPDGPPPVPRLLESIYQIRAGEAKEYSNQAGTVTFVPGLQFRNQVSYVTPFTLDQNNNRYAEPAQATGRIRISPELRLGKKQNISIFGQLDFVNGRWTSLGSQDPVIAEILYPGDDTVAVGQPPGRQYLRPVDARHLYLQWTTKVGQLRIGQMGFTWGQGILANDGNNVDRFGDMRFGDDGPGDIYERVLFGTRPFTPLGGAAENILVAIGADLVYRDERIDLVGSDFKDIGTQVFFVLRYEDPDDPNNWVGGYAVYRRQQNADDNDPYDDDTDLTVGAGDFAGQGVIEFDNDFAFLGAFEGAIIGGKTNAAWNSEYAEHRVLQGGLAGRAYFGKPEIWLAGMDFGYASGDGNPSDGEINNFTFDAGHSVGMVLFQHVNGWRTAQSEILATNGELTGEPINGSQFIPTRGAVTNAVYFHPKARYALDDVFELWGGPLFALAPDDITDPYATRLNGGTGTNSLGGDGSGRFYGTELDIGLRARYEFKKIWFQAGVQAGYLIPGLGLADASGDKGNPIFATQLRTELRY
jgi:hypothetical protein